jgi:uncharacterized RDD family membrane protein YckC
MVMFYDGLIVLGLLVVASAIALPFGDADKTAFRHFWFTLWLAATCFAYFGASWRYAGMTLGMRAWRVKLVSRDGRALSWTRCLSRFIAGLVSLGALGLGVAWALVDGRNRTWHDLIAGTLLLRTDKEKR